MTLKGMHGEGLTDSRMDWIAMANWIRSELRDDPVCHQVMRVCREVVVSMRERIFR